MTKVHRESLLSSVSISLIDVLNPRDRNNRTFDSIVENIKNVGLKKPIIVTPRTDPDGNERFLLICGEGRMKAFQALGQTAIPAMVVEVDDEDGFIMSLAENMARRQARTLELLSGIQQLLVLGYSKKDIARKVGLSIDYVTGILQLLQQGEERLLMAVEAGRIPLNAALFIARAGTSDKDVQGALQDAYEKGDLRGNQLIHARKVIERRRVHGRSVARNGSRKRSEVTSTSLVRAYQIEVGRQKLMIKKAEFAQQRLLFVIQAMRQLSTDENFINLLRAEGLDTMPKNLAERISSRGCTP